LNRLIGYGILVLIVSGCALNDDYKQMPDSHGPPYHLHAFIWNSDSLKSEPLEAMITMDDKGITSIESWDGTKKTNQKFFKTLKVHWDAIGAGGHFKMFEKSYTIQVIDDVDDVYSATGRFRKPDSLKK